MHIEFDDFCDAKIAERFGSLFDRVGGGFFLGFFAATDQQNHIVDALRHVVLPFKSAMPHQTRNPCHLPALRIRFQRGLVPDSFPSKGALAGISES